MGRKTVFSFVAIVLVANLGVSAEDKEVTDEQYSRFPRLFHLDDYEGCLARPGGLYCMGTFYLKPMRDPDPLYELMKEFSEDPHNFNHTLLHRGYCVSSRCGPQHGDAVARFQDCAARWGRKQGYRVMLQEVRYCRTREQMLAEATAPMDTPKLIFLIVVYGILLLNIVGTTYDVISNDGKKSSLLTAWSVRNNWSQLVGPYPDGDPRLVAMLPIEGFRVILMLLVIFTHVGIIHDQHYQQNPRLVEQVSHQPIMMILQNGTSAIQMFILLSSFLLAHHLLNAKPQPPSFAALPKLIIKRIVRISPIYLLVLGYAATWWPTCRDGPMWSHSVGAESAVCRRKWWSHALFINNFVDNNSHCLVQTWFLAVELQLYVLGCVITLCLARIRRLALPILGTAFLASCILNGVMAYVNGWKPLLLLSVPDNLRTMYHNEPSFRDSYTHPLGSLPAMLMGLFVAHLRYETNLRGFRPAEHKWLQIPCQLIIPLLPCWTASGYFLRDMRSPLWTSLYIAVERPTLTLLSAIILFGTYKSTQKKDIKRTVSSKPSYDILKWVFCWRIWYPMGRASLSVLMVHWCVALIIIAGRLTPITTSAIDMNVDFLATAFSTYMISVPLTLLVEIPIKRFYSALVS